MLRESSLFRTFKKHFGLQSLKSLQDLNKRMPAPATAGLTKTTRNLSKIRTLGRQLSNTGTLPPLKRTEVLAGVQQFGWLINRRVGFAHVFQSVLWSSSLNRRYRTHGSCRPFKTQCWRSFAQRPLFTVVSSEAVLQAHNFA